MKYLSSSSLGSSGIQTAPGLNEGLQPEQERIPENCLLQLPSFAMEEQQQNKNPRPEGFSQDGPGNETSGLICHSTPVGA